MEWEERRDPFRNRQGITQGHALNAETAASNPYPGLDTGALLDGCGAQAGEAFPDGRRRGRGQGAAINHEIGIVRRAGEDDIGPPFGPATGKPFEIPLAAIRT